MTDYSSFSAPAVVFDLPFFAGCRDDFIKMITPFLTQVQFVKTLVVCTPNPEQIMLSRRDSQFLQDLRAADVLLADGSGVVWASKVSGRSPVLPERVAGVDVVADLLYVAQREHLQVFVIGGRGYDQKHLKNESQLINVAGWTVEQLVAARQNPQQAPVFWFPGYQDAAHPTPEEEAQLETVLAQLRPQLVFIALGAPYQEHIAQTHRQLFEQHGVRCVMVVGGAFDFLTGKVRRAPKWMQQQGLEWLYRLSQEPWRLRRQLKLLPFIGLILRGKN